MPEQDLDVFTEEQDVAQSSTAGSGWLRVLLALIGAGVLAAVVVVIVSALLTADQPSATYAPSNDDDVVCGGEASCTDLTLTQIEQLVALDLPDGTQIVTSRYEQTADAILVEARAALPDGSANPFEGSAYFEVDESKVTVPAGIEPIGTYGATGEQGALNADGILGTDSDGRTIVTVQLTRAL